MISSYTFSILIKNIITDFNQWHNSCYQSSRFFYFSSNLTKKSDWLAWNKWLCEINEEILTEIEKYTDYLDLTDISVQ